MKNTRLFIFITALLLTLLMVVGCDNSPISVTPERGLVKACINIGNGSTKDLLITNADSNFTNYKIALVPEWNTLDNGTPIYGKIGSVENGKIINGKAFDASSSSIDLGFITPGKWTIYVEAYKTVTVEGVKKEVVLQAGKTTVYFVSNDINATIILQPVSEGEGTLDVLINVQKLYINKEDHEKNYKLFYTLESAQSGIVVPETEMKFHSWDSNGAHDNRSYGVNVSVPQDSYIIKFILKERYEIAEGETEWRVVGGITRSVEVVANETSSIYGNVSPSEFIPVEIDIPAPSIVATFTNKPSSTVELNSTISFSCEDSTGNGSGYNRKFIWYVNGVEAVDDDTTTEDISEFSMKFDEIGRYEVRCEVVYYTSGLSHIGGVSCSFMVV